METPRCPVFDEDGNYLDVTFDQLPLKHPEGSHNLSPTSSHVFLEDNAGDEVVSKSARFGASAVLDVGDRLLEPPSTPQGVGAAVARAVEDVRGRELEDWQALFILARRLKAVPEFDAASDREPIDWFCRATGIPPALGHLDFPVRWAAVKAPDLDIRSAAGSLARSKPVCISGPDTPELIEAASFCYYLFRFTRPHPFILSHEDMGRFLLHLSPQPTVVMLQRAKKAGGRALRRLIESDVIRMATDYEAHSKARTYLFTGTLLGADA